jgi:hypothetical protein
VAKAGIEVAVGSVLYRTDGYTWEAWQKVSWHERLKAGVDQGAQALADVTRRRYGVSRL